MISNFHFCEIIFSFKIPKNWFLYCQNWCLNAKIGILNTKYLTPKKCFKIKKVLLKCQKSDYHFLQLTPAGVLVTPSHLIPWL